MPQSKPPQMDTRLIKKLLEKMSLKGMKRQEIYNDIGSLPSGEGRTTSIVNRLGRWLEQIAGLEKQEMDILCEIKEIEEKHKNMRKAKKLRKVEQPSPEGGMKKEKQSRFWLWFWAFILMREQSKPKPSPKKDLKNG